MDTAGRLGGKQRTMQSVFVGEARLARSFVFSEAMMAAGGWVVTGGGACDFAGHKAG